MEEWKTIDGLNGYYQVSNYGRIKSISRTIIRGNRAIMTIKERIIKTCKTKSGYEHAVLQNGPKTKHFAVHRLVALAFIDNPENKEQVNHIDGVKTNNHVSNLEWATRSENEKHAHKIRLKDWRGENQSRVKLNNEKVLQIRELKGKYTGRQVAEMYNVGHAAIFAIWNNRTWTHI